MSVFKDEPTSNPTEEKIASYLEKIIEEKGENWKDPETLAKGKYEADKYIGDLERQLEELRKDVVREEKLDKLMDMFKSQTKDPQESGGSNTLPDKDPNDTSSGPMTDEQIRALIETHVSQRESETTRQKNLKEVDAFMQKEYGATANATIRAKAAELSMTVQELEETAARNPRAFLRLIGAETGRTKDSSSLVGNSRRAEAVSISPTGRDWDYYQTLRRKSKATYFNPATQKQLVRDREEMGDAFWGASRSNS
jgi:hypothetical protein